MTRGDFEDAVSEALDSMPERFAELIDNVVVQVEEEPDGDTLIDLDLDPEDMLEYEEDEDDEEEEHPAKKDVKRRKRRRRSSR